MKKLLLIGIGTFSLGLLLFIFFKSLNTKSFVALPLTTEKKDQITQENPLSINSMRKQTYPGSKITIEQTLDPGSNYNRYITSYLSDGFKIYALLTVPEGKTPKNGWPVIIFNHGYIPPAEYSTTERYVAYTDAFSRNGYIVFRPDYRGHGKSEGKPEGAYYSPAYTVDVLNAVSSIKKYKDANPQRIGMWGHSLGGSITLRTMVINKDIKAGVIWAGVVASYEDLANNWHRSQPFIPSERERATRRPSRLALIEKYGDFKQNPGFWESIAPIYHVKDISGPLQLHHGTLDQEVPVLFSERLKDALQKAGKTVEFYTYDGDDHNLSQNLSLALDRSVRFFDTYLKK
ncbi:MAG: alpha/beta fold hydrolase [Candidatus Levybacteria bacterium]|nr:alpha/beta fold hydrolase [Candidatus Levybacteria bacterium]